MTTQKQYKDALAKMFRQNFSVKDKERALILTDDQLFLKTDPVFGTDRVALAHLAGEAAEELGLQTTVYPYIQTGGHGVEPPLDVWMLAFGGEWVQWAQSEAQLDGLIAKTLSPEARDVVVTQMRQSLKESERKFDLGICLAHFSISHTMFRKLLTEGAGTRVATMPGVQPEMFLGVMDADWQKVAERCVVVAKALSSAAKAQITSEDGSVLTMSLAGREGLADTGLIGEAGFGNLPGGESFIAPVEGTANGSFVAYGVDGKHRVRFTLADGKLVQVEQGDRSTEKLESLFPDHANVANLAELGVGTNDAATDTTSVLEGEKIYGTIHLAFGDNASFGGTVSAPFHQDYIVPGPTLELIDADGNTTVLIDQGQPSF